MRLAGEVLYWQQFDDGDAEIFQIPGDWLGTESRISASQLRWDIGVLNGQALDVRLVDHGVSPGGLGPLFA